MEAATAEDDLVSRALERWRTERRALVDVGRALCSGQRPGTSAHDHLLGAYLSTLTAQFQGFCADLLTDIARALVGGVPLGVPAPVAAALDAAMTAGRAVDAGNPTVRNLDRDFGRFGLRVSAALTAINPASPERLGGLSALLRARNAVAHATADLSTLGPGGRPLTTDRADGWRHDIDVLADTLDEAVRHHLRTEFGLVVRFAEEDSS
jgi:hypothetical protein